MSTFGQEQPRDDNNGEAKRKKNLFCVRLIVFVVLGGAAVLISWFVYTFLKRAEENEMHMSFGHFADQIVETFYSIPHQSLGAAASLAVAMTDSGLKDSEMGWPFVTLGSFEHRAEIVKNQSGAIYIGINPIVQNDQREMWENYTLRNADAQWYQQSIHYQEMAGIMDLDIRPQVETNEPNLDLANGVANHIFYLDRSIEDKAFISPSDPFYVPIWQTSPATRRTVVNQNRASNSAGVLKCLEEDAIIFEGLQYSTPGFADDSDPDTSEIAWLLSAAKKETTEYVGDVFTSIYIPLYNTLQVDQRTTVGVMQIILHWAHYFEKLWPKGVNGIVFVLDNNCDAPYTYQVDGDEVIALGSGDLHDAKYDHFIHTASFENVKSIVDGTEQGIPFYQGECLYTINVYPSNDFENMFTSSQPVVMTVVVALMFSLVAFSFCYYDFHATYF